MAPARVLAGRLLGLVNLYEVMSAAYENDVTRQLFHGFTLLTWDQQGTGMLMLLNVKNRGCSKMDSSDIKKELINELNCSEV